MAYSEEEILAEISKCKQNPYYFATKYIRINGQPFTTHLTESSFNKLVKDYERVRRVSDKRR
jgi:hypothetical protein